MEEGGDDISLDRGDMFVAVVFCRGRSEVVDDLDGECYDRRREREKGKRAEGGNC